MKKTLIATALIIIFLAVFIPLASSNPDGLAKVAATFGADEHKPVWNGLMTDYSLAGITNPYVATLLTGSIGTIIVLLSALLLEKTIGPKNPAKTKPTNQKSLA